MKRNYTKYVKSIHFPKRFILFRVTGAEAQSLGPQTGDTQDGLYV